jgi:hypothetical protein
MEICFSMVIIPAPGFCISDCSGFLGKSDYLRAPSTECGKLWRRWAIQEWRAALNSRIQTLQNQKLTNVLEMA